MSVIAEEEGVVPNSHTQCCYGPGFCYEDDRKSWNCCLCWFCTTFKIEYASRSPQIPQCSCPGCLIKHPWCCPENIWFDRLACVNCESQYNDPESSRLCQRVTNRFEFKSENYTCLGCCCFHHQFDFKQKNQQDGACGLFPLCYCDCDRMTTILPCGACFDGNCYFLCCCIRQDRLTGCPPLCLYIKRENDNGNSFFLPCCCYLAATRQKPFRCYSPCGCLTANQYCISPFVCWWKRSSSELKQEIDNGQFFEPITTVWPCLCGWQHKNQIRTPCYCAQVTQEVDIQPGDTNDLKINQFILEHAYKYKVVATTYRTPCGSYRDTYQDPYDAPVHQIMSDLELTKEYWRQSEGIQPEMLSTSPAASLSRS